MKQMLKVARKPRYTQVGGDSWQLAESDKNDRAIISKYMERIFECKLTEECRCVMCVDDPERNVRAANRERAEAEYQRQALIDAWTPRRRPRSFAR